MQRYKNSFNLQSIFIQILIKGIILHIILTYINSYKLLLTVKILSLQKKKFIFSSKENTIYKVNQEATVEIAKQLRLRNISGIIVIDYIDMEEEKDRKNIMNLLEKELKKDRSKTQVMGFTKLDLLEMTRKKL